MFFCKKMINKKLIIGICIAAICGVALSMIVRHLTELRLQVPDENGESKELCYYTDEFIEDCYTDYRVIGRKVTSNDLTSSGVQGVYKDCDLAHNHTELGKLSGVYILNAYLGNGGVVQYTIDSQVSEGNMRIVITDQDNRILYDVPIDEKATISFEAEKDAEYYVKLVGESAKVSLEMWRSTVNP